MRKVSKKDIIDLYHKIANEGFGYYMMHYGPDLDLIEKLGFSKEKVMEAITLFCEIEQTIQDRCDEE